MSDPRLADIIRTGRQTESCLYPKSHDFIQTILGILGIGMIVGIILFFVFSLGSAFDKEFQFQDEVTKNWVR